MSVRELPSDFIIGTSTSAFQIEGATDVDGRGPSIWDWFAEQPGKIADGSDGRIACDHYHRYREDVQLIQSLGVSAYRFSVAWPRVVPDGEGAINERGLDFYDRLVDALLEHKIEPHITLYHWDLPLALHQRGGWTSRDVVAPFVAYTEAVVKRLGDRVQSWVTHNEPWCASFLGYEVGEHAPGHTSRQECLKAAHHLLLSHGEALQCLRSHVSTPCGIVLNLARAIGASESEGDDAARRLGDGRLNEWFLDPLHGRGYPDHVVEVLGEDMGFVKDGDLEAIAQPLDFIGVNYYTRSVLKENKADPSRPHALEAPKSNRTDIGWEVIPSGLTDLLVWLNETYRPNDIYITENGAAYHTPPDDSGRIPDVERERYLHSHLNAILDAREMGVPVSAWFVWSLMDNFEWGFGYGQRFGIVWVDYETLERTIKDSGLWVQKLCKSRTVVAEEQS